MLGPEAQSTVESGGKTLGWESDSTCITVVLPAYNEGANLPEVIREISAVLEKRVDVDPASYEIIVVDDGSTDDTAALLEKLTDEYPAVVGIRFTRNFGQSAALAAGIDASQGDYIVTMDADGQNDPADIPKLIEMLEAGYDCVSGWRRDREGPLSKRIPSAIQTRLAKLTGPDINDFGCTLTAYRASALADIRLYGEAHRYIPAMLHKRGYRITEVEVNHRPRTSGQTKYGWRRLIRGFVDLCFHIFWNRYSTRPLHFLGGAGILSFLLGLVIGGHAVLLKYALGQSLIPRLPRLILTVALILFGIQLVMFGFMAEVLVKLYYRDDTPYRIAEVVRGDEQDAPEPTPDT
jgi:glycosyltransferase involved in cell wall biosynthesis